jgi:uncharacterized membrane protein
MADEKFAGILADLAAGWGDIEKIIADFKAEFAPKLGAEKLGVDLIGIKLWRGFVSKVLQRHLTAELANTGKLTTAQAKDMVAAGIAMTGPVPVIVAGREGAAATGMFANIVSWIEVNLPTLLQEFITIAPLIMQLIAAFGG